jgi:AcrR family transcriptional regulator
MIERNSKSELAQNNILKAASDLFLSGGVKAISARAIAQKAGVSTMGIYSHFNGKQGILDALYIEGFELVSQAMNVDAGLTPLASLMQATDQYLSLGENYEAHYRLIFGEADSGYEPSAEAKAIRLESFGKLVAVTSTLLPASGAETEGSSDERGRQFALEIWALLHGFVSLKHHTLGAISNDDSPAKPSRWNWKDSARAAIRRLAASYRID